MFYIILLFYSTVQNNTHHLHIPRKHLNVFRIYLKLLIADGFLSEKSLFIFSMGICSLWNYELSISDIDFLF